MSKLLHCNFFQKIVFNVSFMLLPDFCPCGSIFNFSPLERASVSESVPFLEFLSFYGLLLLCLLVYFRLPAVDLLAEV